MPTGGKSTLTKFLIEARRRVPGATGELNALITDVSLACKAIAKKVAYGSLGELLATPAPSGAPLQTACHELFVRATNWGGQSAGIVSGAEDGVYLLPTGTPRGKYLLLFNPLEGAANARVNVPVGSIFSILRAPRPKEDPVAEDFLQPGERQVCSGYAIYGPATMLVLTLGHGTHGFTLDPQLGEWVLSHPEITIPDVTSDFAIDPGQSRHWGVPVKRYVDECLAGHAGPRGADFRVRWIASLVTEAHRILMRGGVFLSPGGNGDSTTATSPRLLDEANPIAYLIEQAGGCANTGHGRVADVVPAALRQTTPLYCGSRLEVERIARYHAVPAGDSYNSSLFAHRGLFSSPG
ncbi:MAG: fructose-1,6-bisphosphatase [Gemmatimonadetes bacterium]|nr:fructose-1,6-bisphosphatase [Gemmatimonadota bacterium]MBK9549298.1 fructose-1,6-bisphosphatase [Gemmatimonadota bacterium]MBP9897310.1 fructose-1,6-bisphosphatase [Gemmatimonadales bacterium]